MAKKIYAKVKKFLPQKSDHFIVPDERGGTKPNRKTPAIMFGSEENIRRPSQVTVSNNYDTM